MISNKDSIFENVEKDIDQFLSLAESIRSDVYNCRPSDKFLNNIYSEGGIYEKYSHDPFPRSSSLFIKFDGAMRKIYDAKR